MPGTSRAQTGLPHRVTAISLKGDRGCGVEGFGDMNKFEGDQ